MKIYPMKRILLCTDFSEASNLALKESEELRIRSGGQIDLLHVAEIPISLSHSLTSYYGLKFERDFLEQLTGRIHSQLKTQLNQCNVTGNVKAEYGPVVEKIVEITNSGNYDLLVLGFEKKGWIRSKFHKIISNSHIPVMVVKKPFDFTKVEGLVDEKHNIGLIIAGTFDFFRTFKYESLSLVSVCSKSGDAVKLAIKEEAEHFSEGDPAPAYFVMEGSDWQASELITDHLNHDHTNVAIAKKFAHGDLKKIYLGSTTRKLLNSFEGNLLILPP